MASDFNAGEVDECPEVYPDLDGCLKDGVRLQTNYGDSKALGFDPEKGRWVGVEPDRFSTNVGKGIPVGSSGWKRSKSLDSEMAEWWNEEGVVEDRKLFEQVPYDYVPSLIDGEHKQSCLARFGNDGGNLIPGRTEQVPSLMPCTSGTPSNFSNKQAIAQNGLECYLPSDWTIFDSDIEAFARKPWRHQESDKTDFFNFGLDEESWKSYRDSVVKAYEHFPTNVLVDEVNGFDPGEKNSVVLNNLQRVGIEFGLTTGTAIPVEIGVVERIPSYLRSFRCYDPDAVIQISLVDNVEENVKEPFPSVDVKQENAEGQRSIKDLAMVSDDDVYNCLLSVEHEGQISGEFTNSAEHNHQKVESNVSMILSFDAVEGNDKNPGRQEEGLAEAESECSLGKEVLNRPKPHDLENHYEASEDSFPYLKVTYTPKRVSLNSDSGPQVSNMPECNLSNEDSRITCKTKVEDVAHDCIIQLRGGKYDSEKKTQRDAELDVLGNDDQNHNWAGKMHQTPDVMSLSAEKDDCSWMKKSMEGEHHFFREGGRHNTDTSSLRERSPDSWRSGEKYMGHSRLRSIVEIPSKNRGDSSIIQGGIDCHQSSYRKGRHSSYAKYQDYDNNDLRVGERSVNTEKTVHSGTKRLNHPKVRRYCAANDVNIRHCKRLPQDQLSCRRNSKYGIDRIYKKAPRRRKLFDDHLLSNARKKLLAEGFEEIVSCGYPTESQCIFGRDRPEIMALGHKKGVSISSNGWEGKVSEKTNSLGNRSIWERLGDDYAADKETKDLMGSHPTYKVKANNRHLTKSKLRRMRKRKSLHSSYATRVLPKKCPASKGNEDDENEKGELTEKPGCKEPVSMKKKQISDNEDAQLDFAVHQSDHVPEDKIYSKDVQKKNMLAEDHDSKCLLETMAKMERRRERFKESLLPKQEYLKTQNPPVDSTAVMNEVMQLRPTRKRLWRTVS